MTAKIARPALDAPASEWLVYGDALQEAGDVRGELIGLSHAVDEGRTAAGVRDAYVTRYATQLLGAAAEELAFYRLSWRFCELVAVEIRIGPDDDGAARVRAILDAPCAERLTAVTLTGTPGITEPVDLSDALAVVAARETITSLGLVDERAREAAMLVSRDFDPGDNLVTFGSLAPLWPRLERLSLDVADSHALAELERIDAPALRAFALRSLRFADWEEAQVMCGRLAAASWPRLEDLELRLTEALIANVPNEIDPYIPVYSADDYDGRDDADEGDGESIAWDRDLAPVLARLAACPLRRLALTSFMSTTPLLDALAASQLMGRLEVLDLSDSALGSSDLEWFEEHAALFARLPKLVLHRTGFSEDEVARLRALGPAVEATPGSGARYRYVVGQE